MPTFEETLARMKALYTYGQEVNEAKKQPNSTLEFHKQGADGLHYGIVKECNKYYIKSAPNGKENLVESYDYLGGFCNKRDYEYSSYSNALKQLKLKLGSINEANDAKVQTGCIDNFQPTRLMTESTESMRDEIARQRQIMYNVSMIMNESTGIKPKMYNGENPESENGKTGAEGYTKVTPNPEFSGSKTSKKEKSTPFTNTPTTSSDQLKEETCECGNCVGCGCKQDANPGIGTADTKKNNYPFINTVNESDEPDDENIDIDDNFESEEGDTNDDDLDFGVEPNYKDSEEDDLENSDEDDFEGSDEDDLENSDEDDFEGSENDELGDNDNEYELNININDTDDLNDDGFEDDNLEGDGFEDDDFDGDDLENKDFEDDDLEGDGFKDDDFDGNDLENKDFEDDDLEGDNFEDDDLENDGFEDDDFEKNDGDIEECGYANPNAMLESKQYKMNQIVNNVVNKILAEEELHVFGKHPGYQKKPMTLPTTGQDNNEWGEDWNDDSVYSEEPFGTKIGDGTPFNKLVNNITRDVMYQLKNGSAFSKKKTN